MNEKLNEMKKTNAEAHIEWDESSQSRKKQNDTKIKEEFKLKIEIKELDIEHQKLREILKLKSSQIGNGSLDFKELKEKSLVESKQELNQK